MPDAPAGILEALQPERFHDAQDGFGAAVQCCGTGVGARGDRGALAGAAQRVGGALHVECVDAGVSGRGRAVG
jgi:hypothetical protein